MSEVIVIGSGAAGLSAALAAHGRHRVTVFTKGQFGEGNSRMAQGGIAAVTSPEDSVAAHVDDTLTAGAGWADPEAVRILCAGGQRVIDELLALGMPFDREGDSLARGTEAAHSAARVLHADGAATGGALMATLTAAVRESTIEVVERAFLCELLTDTRGSVTRVVGAEFLIAGRTRRVFADAVIIATGGAGQLYSHTTNPAGATGDGIAAALRAGAALGDMEFVQFHPTALAVPGTPLISEAVRGEGATLLDEHGRRFMLDHHPDAELAPRDVLARAIAERQQAQQGRPVLLDARAIGGERLAERFPGLTALCREHGFDWGVEPVPVTPAAHYLMGGILVDDSGRSSLRGLFAVGEAACTGAHGANRLASNSLLEALVFGARAAAAIADPWPLGVPNAHRRSPAVEDAPARGIPCDRAALQRIMWLQAGLHRDAAGLGEAATVLASWSADTSSVEGRETSNLLQLARVVVAAASARSSSLGAHHRNDSLAQTARTHFRETVPA